MSLIENLEKALIETLNENNKAIQQYGKNYDQVKEFMEKFSEAAITEYREQGLPEAVIEAIQESAMQKEEKVKKIMGDNKLNVEIIKNNGEIYLPVRMRNGTSLEAEIVGHVCAVIKEPIVGVLGEYIAIKGRTVKKTLQTPSNNLKMANVSLEVVEATLPVSGIYEAQRELHVDLTPSAIEYGLIPVRKRDNAPEFFPDLKEPFHIVTPTGKAQVHVSSGSRYAPRSGNYVIGCDGVSTFKKAIHKMNLEVGDTLIVTELKPKTLYSIRKA